MASIRQITKKDKDIIAHIKDYNERSAYFTLIKKSGKLATNDDGHAIIYQTSLPDSLCDPKMALIEAYSYLSYWADAECDFKEFSVQELFSQSFTHGDIIVKPDQVFEQESYNAEFSGSLNEKAICKLRSAIVDYQEATIKLEKRINKFSDFLEKVDENRNKYKTGNTAINIAHSNDVHLDDEYDYHYDDEFVEYAEVDYLDDEDDYPYDEELDHPFLL